VIQVSMMACDARPHVLASCIERLEDPTGGALFSVPLLRPPAFYWASPSSPPALPRWTIRPIPKGKPYLPQFWRVLLDADPSVDLLWLEDDVWIVEDGLPLIASLELPPWAGAVSFFDFRNECVASGFYRMPFARPLWGTQAVRIPAAALERLQHLARARPLMPPDDLKESRADAANSWDGWLGRAVEALGLYMALYSPSLVQHLGTELSAISPKDHTRPIALNFPEPWPHEGRIIDPFWCDFHGARHEVHSICPQVTR
jgi:hypothetical protein